MKSNRMILFLLLGALISGGLAVYFTNSYIDRKELAYRQQLDKEYEAEKIVVATRDLKVGTVIDGSTVAMRDIPATFVHRAAIRPDQFDSVVGKKLVIPLGSGEPLLPEHVTVAQADAFSSLIKEGDRAVTIEVDRVSSVSGLLVPGDYVDLLVSTDGVGDESMTLPVLHNVKILATGHKTGLELVDDGMPSPYQTVTLSLSPEQSAKIIHARRIGTISAVLRNPGDKEVAYEGKITKTSLVGKRKKEEPKVLGGIEIILGGQ